MHNFEKSEKRTTAIDYPSKSERFIDRPFNGHQYSNKGTVFAEQIYILEATNQGGGVGRNNKKSTILIFIGSVQYAIQNDFRWAHSTVRL